MSPVPNFPPFPTTSSAKAAWIVRTSTVPNGVTSTSDLPWLLMLLVYNQDKESVSYNDVRDVSKSKCSVSTSPTQKIKHTHTNTHTRISWEVHPIKTPWILWCYHNHKPPWGWCRRSCLILWFWIETPHIADHSWHCTDKEQSYNKWRKFWRCFWYTRLNHVEPTNISWLYASPSCKILLHGKAEKSLLFWRRTGRFHSCSRASTKPIIVPPPVFLLVSWLAHRLWPFTQYNEDATWCNKDPHTVRCSWKPICGWFPEVMFW